MLVYLADALAILALLSFTGALVGQMRGGHLQTRIRAASQSIFLGILPLVLGLLTLADMALAVRGLLLGVFLLLTAAVSSHAVGHAGFERERQSLEGEREREREGA